jgi:DNA (cytosine-5)-methyltransferase 1
MLGNAVPSALAEVLAREMRRQFLGDKADLGPPKLIPPVRRPIPDPEPLLSVPLEYHSMIGDHSDHPGEGRLSGKPRNIKARKQQWEENQPSLMSAADFLRTFILETVQ